MSEVAGIERVWGRQESSDEKKDRKEEGGRGICFFCIQSREGRDA
jgi:hypothetical protein